MAVRTIAELKAMFETGDQPSQQNFVDVIDSFLHAQAGNFPNPLPAVSAANLTNIPIPDPLPAVSGEFLTNINRSDWVAIAAVPSYATSTSFVVTGNYTGVGFFVVGVRVRIHLNPAGYHFTSVVSATFAAGPNTTTVVVADAIPTSALASVDVNLLVDSNIVITSLQPGSGAALTVYRKNAGGTAIEPWAIPAGSATEPSLVELATAAETQALADAARGVTPAGLAAAAVSAPTADRLMRRDAAGRAQVAAPALAADIARKDTVDAVQASVDGHAAAATGVHGVGASTVESAAGAQAKADAVQANLNAHVAAGDPHAQYATDSDLAAHSALTNPHSAASAATANRLMLRDAAGRAQVVTPAAAADIATKAYADGVFSLVGNGYTKLPNGLILQWGVNSVATDTNLVITFPLAFPNTCFSVSGSSMLNDLSNWEGIKVIATSAASFTAQNAIATANLMWIAVGY